MAGHSKWANIKHRKGAQDAKRGKVFKTNSQMIKFIKNELNNNDYLMVKASNATGFNKIVNELKGLN